MKERREKYHSEDDEGNIYKQGEMETERGPATSKDVEITAAFRGGFRDSLLKSTEITSLM